MLGSHVAMNASKSRACHNSTLRRWSSTFSCDIALLREPHGFEGFGTSAEVFNSDHLARVNPEDSPVVVSDGYPALLAAHLAHLMGNHSVILSVDHLGKLIGPRLPGFLGLQEEVPDCLPTSNRGRLGPIAARNGFQRVIADRAPGISVAPTERLKRPAHDLHVFL